MFISGGGKLATLVQSVKGPQTQPDRLTDQPMIKLAIEVTFATPAFLGDADQSGRWRTPPFKSLLRQWWRVVWARDHSPEDNRGLLEAESRLFGSVSGESGRRSRLRLRLDGWQPGTLQRSQWTAVRPGFLHEEVGDAGRTITADSYLGFGPVEPKGLRNARAIDAGESRQLAIAIAPGSASSSQLEVDVRQLRETLSLINAYGALGGRSRNGWGSIHLRAADGAMEPQPPFKDWREVLRTDWPSAIGCDARGPLVWVTEPEKDWRGAMARLAILRYQVRREFRLDGIASPHASPAERHWLSYPMTHHPVRSWVKTARLPNSLRFKVRRTGDAFVGLIFHMPVLPLEAIFHPKRDVLLKVWSTVHQKLDDSALRLKRAPY